MLTWYLKKLKAYSTLHPYKWHTINALACIMFKMYGASEEGVIPAKSQGFYGRDGY